MFEHSVNQICDVHKNILSTISSWVFDLTLIYEHHADVANYLRLPYSSASNGTDYFNASFVNVSDIPSQQVMSVVVCL